MLTRTATVMLNTATNFFRFGLLIVIFFLLTPFIINSIGKEEFGLWSLVFSILGVFGLLDMGFGTGVVKWVSESKASGDFQKRNEILSTVLMIYLVLSVIGIGLVTGMSFFFNTLFSIPLSQHEKATGIFWILAARMLVLYLPLSIFRGILFGEQKIYILNFVQSAFSLIYAGMVFFFLEMDYGIVALAWINLAVMLGEHLTYIVFSQKFCFQLKLSLKLADYKLFKEAASFSFFSFIVQASALILLRADTILIKFFMPLSAVAVYAIALKVTEYIHLVIKQFTNVLMPVVAELKDEGNNEKIRFLMLNASKFAMAPAVMILVMILLYADESIIFWVGESFSAASDILRVLVIAIVLAVPQLSAATVLTMTGNHKYFAYASAIGIPLNIGLSIVLISELGLVGVALGTLLTVLVIDLFVIIKKAYLLYQIKYSALFTRVFLPSFIPGIMQFAVALLLKTFFPPTNLFYLIFVNIPGVIIYGIVFWLFSIEPSERKLLKEKLIKFNKTSPNQGK